MADYLISYSHDDDVEVERYEHLLLMRGVTVERDRHLQRGDPTDELIIAAIKRSRGSIQYITPGFAGSRYLREKEIPWLLERRAADSTFAMLPVFRGLTPRKIEESDEFAHLRALPVFLGSAIEDFEQQSRAVANEAVVRVVGVKADAARTLGRITLVISGRAPVGVDGDLVLDWTHLFGNGRAASAVEWESDIVPALADIKSAIEAKIPSENMRIRLLPKMSLASAFAIGQQFPWLSTYRLELPDKDGVIRGAYEPTSQPHRLKVDAPVRGEGADLVITVSLTQQIAASGEDWLRRRPFKMRIDIRADAIGEGFVTDEAHINAIANEVTRVIKRSREDHQTRGVRLVYLGPTTVAVALGVRLKAVGPIVFPDFENRTDTYVDTTIFA